MGEDGAECVEFCPGASAETQANRWICRGFRRRTWVKGRVLFAVLSHDAGSYRTIEHGTEERSMGLEDKFPEILTSQLSALVNWSRKNSLWPLPLGLSCCAIEFMATASSKFDMARFGAEVARFSPRQADVMIVAGTCTYKMAEAARRLYDQMAEPKWVISMGACASSGGMYRSYAVVQGIDTFLPVDFYISGCPPRPENVLNTLMKLQKKIEGEKILRS